MSARWAWMPGIPPATTQEEVDRRIQVWHTGQVDEELHDYLGWTQDQYHRWLTEGVIPIWKS